jgi:hypothetical protein
MTSTFEPDSRFGHKPLYAALFSTERDVDIIQLPFGPGPLSSNDSFTVPHGLDREIAASLPGLWYCIHLPNDFSQLIDVSALELKRSQVLHLDHRILLVPIQIFDRDHVGYLIDPSFPVMAICPDELASEASQRTRELGFPLGVVSYRELSDESLRTHWRAIHDHFIPDAPYLGREPKLSRRLDFAATDLPTNLIARQFGNEDGITIDGDQDSHVTLALWHQTVLAATARLEREGTTPEAAKELLPKVVEEERMRMRTPVALALPGVPPWYSSRYYDTVLRRRIEQLPSTDEADVWSLNINERSDALVERAAIEFVTAHRAIARGGVGIIFPSIPAKAFVVLNELERHFSNKPTGPVVWRLLKRLNEAASPIWEDTLHGAVGRASTITAFSNFPIGLLQLPGDSEVLTTRKPISYRPILPLTRALQWELSYVPPIDVTEGFRVLVAECISAEDPVGRYSRMGWSATQKNLRRAHRPMEFEIVETLSFTAFRSAIEEFRPHFLVISAHGIFNRGSNVAGLMIGHDAWLGQGMSPRMMPPVVILSACHVAPRGSGAVSITDLLLREGAVAVLGTQVPVDVYHNAILMSRFFTYIKETLLNRAQHSDLLEVWHRTQTTNAVIDIINGNKSLRSWGYGLAASGRSVLEEFMLFKSVGRLRDIYGDTEQLLGEIADEQGMGDRVRNWFRSPGYIPESLFYVFAGRPDRIYLNTLQDTMRRYG